ncbi:MAG: hypothetical protein ACRC33_00215 [Gemmataceae bacterium]
MVEPWYDPIRYGWIPGTAFGVLGGLFGSLVGVLGPRRPGQVIGGLWVGLAGSAALLTLSVVALIQGQPYGVWYGLGLPGLLGTVLAATFLVTLRPVILRAHRDEEERRMQARDLG